MVNEIVEFYSEYNEKGRLIERHSLEKIRTQEIILRHLAKKPQKIIDIGGAAGVYSFWLAELGHIVDLIDLVPKHIQQIKEIETIEGKKINSAIVGNALALPYEDNLYDIALLMGPLYHLQDREQRILALKEAKRVLKKDGILFAAAITKYASMLDGFKYDLIADPEFQNIMLNDIKTGKHNNVNKIENYFTYSYFHSPNELKNEVEEAGLKYMEILPVEGFGNIYKDVEMKMEDESYSKLLLECILLTESDPTFLAVSSHYLIVGKK